MPAPIATPTSAVRSAGASFTPSPTIATRLPRPWSSRILSTFSSGSTSANTMSIPSSAATASATGRASPVSITTSIPAAWSRSTAS